MPWGRGTGSTRAVLAMGTLSPGLSHSSCPAGGTRLEQLISTQPPACLCSCFSNSLTREKKGFLGRGELWGCGDTSQKGCRDPGWPQEGWQRRGAGAGVAIPVRSRAGPGRAQSSGTAGPLPAPPSEGIWGSLHALSRLQGCGNWINGEAEGAANLQDLLSRARLPPV